MAESPASRRIAFATVGCRVNQFETDALRGKAAAADWTVVPFDANADVYVINSCTITAEADADSRRLARQAARRNPGALVALAGCYAEGAPASAAAIPGVDLVLGTAEKADLLAYLDAARTPGAGRIAVGRAQRLRRLDAGEYGPGIAPDRTRAFLKVQDGCSYGCSFCIVPTVRGSNRSLPPDTILAEVARLHAAGFPEVVLTGVHLGTYGRDLAPRHSLTALCAAILALPDAPRLRLSSLDPHEVGDELIHLLVGSRRVCRHLHLPLQSGDEAVLRRMRRGHTAEQFRALVERLALAVPGIAITGDVIAGFPGEDDQAFDRTRDLLAALPIAGLHVFSYSRRSGTDAAGYAEQVPREIIKARTRELRALAAAKADAFGRRFVGEVLEAAVLRSERADGLLEGLTDNYLTVRFPGDAALAGRLARVCITAAEGDALAGVLS